MKSTPSSKARSLSFSPWRIRETIYLRFKGPKKLNLGIYQVLKGERGERGEARQTENPGSPHCMQEMAHTCRRAATAVLVCTHASEIRSAFSHKEQREGRTAARAAGPLNAFYGVLPSFLPCMIPIWPSLLSSQISLIIICHHSRALFLWIPGCARTLGISRNHGHESLAFDAFGGQQPEGEWRSGRAWLRA